MEKRENNSECLKEDHRSPCDTKPGKYFIHHLSGPKIPGGIEILENFTISGKVYLHNKVDTFFKS